MGLSAAWEFLKFSIFNALDQPGFLNMIQGLASAINWVSDLINKYPVLGQTILQVFGLFAAGGAILMILGQFALGWQAMFGAGGVFASQAAVGMASTATKFSKFLGTMRTLAGLGIALYMFNSYMGREEGYVPTALELAKNLGLVGIAGYLGGVPGGLAAFIIWLVFDVKPFVRNKLEKRLQKNQETIDSGEMPGFGAQLSEGLFGGLDALLNPLDFLGHAWDNFAESF